MKIDRLIAIIMILLEREKVTAKYLAEMFEVSMRTIYRDLDVINQAGIPVFATSGPGGGIEIMKEFKVEKRIFSSNDITALMMGLSSIKNNLPGEQTLAALAKVKGMIPKEHYKEWEYRANQMKIDALPWINAGNSYSTVEIIQEALEQQRLLTFEYRDIRNKNSSREVEPYRLLWKGEAWYLQGYCLSRRDFRTFKLLRMSNLSKSDQRFEIRDFPMERLDEVQVRENSLTRVKLKIQEGVRDLVLTRFGEDCLTPDGPDHYIAELYMPVDDLACGYLLSMGTRCVCLEPEEMREKMRRLSSEICGFYQSS
ncbi:YafY family protein [Clostridium boliviensis]|uniref:YafY family protein n=1 Tax=Clostridium boliviensis TaxID=318465 RepID=A0ABU4GGQ5_9CLOT|nr:YafY family protein [Clostridium boliviensis]MDW2796778.1 YafY family protein [Clostridium boliviensis]